MHANFFYRIRSSSTKKFKNLVLQRYCGIRLSIGLWSLELGQYNRMGILIFSSILKLRSCGLPVGHGEALEVRVLPPARVFDLPEFLSGHAPLSTLRHLLPSEGHLGQGGRHEGQHWTKMSKIWFVFVLELRCCRTFGWARVLPGILPKYK